MPAVWAPDGKHYAFLSVDPKLGEGITFANPDGEAHVPVRGVDRLVVWRIAWAPDSKRAAYLVISLGKLGSAGVPMLAIFDVASQRIVLHPIPRETLANYPSFTEGPDQLRWSPDGKKVLASWENVIVADAENGNVQTLLNAPAAAEWASSNATALAGSFPVCSCGNLRKTSTSFWQIRRVSRRSDSTGVASILAFSACRHQVQGSQSAAGSAERIQQVRRARSWCLRRVPMVFDWINL
jgi:hypothetical protein